MDILFDFDVEISRYVQKSTKSLSFKCGKTCGIPFAAHRFGGEGGGGGGEEGEVVGEDYSVREPA